MKPLISICLVMCLCSPVWSQVMSIDTFFNGLLPQVELDPDYGFLWPVRADVLSESGYEPQYSNRYFMSLFGPRYKSTSSSNVGNYDFHQGLDITYRVSYGGTDYNDSTILYHIISMCDGVINKIIDSTDAYLETLGTGRSVRVKCDSSFRADKSWGPIYINYRHLSDLHTLTDSAKTVPADSVRIVRGDTIGVVGESGHTSTVHLHLSIQRYEQGAPGSDYKNMHVMRIFSTDSATHLHAQLDTVRMELLQCWADSALFRLTFPYNQVNIRRIEVRNGTYYRYFDFEDVSDSSDRDHHNLISGLSMYAYSFNRGSTALSRYNSTKDDMPVSYPASPNRDTVPGAYNHHPITFDTTVYVLDMVVNDLGAGYDSTDFQLKITDIYGQTVLGYFPVTGDTLMWTGSQDSLWTNAHNWDGVVVPDSSHIVMVPGKDVAPLQPVVLSGEARCGQLIINSGDGGLVHIKGDGELEVGE